MAKQSMRFSLFLLKTNLRYHKQQRMTAVRGYKRAITNKLGDEIRMTFHTRMRESDKFIDDLESAIKKIAPKKK